MKQTTWKYVRTALAALAGALAMQAGWAQGLAAENIVQPGDPARWYQEDLTAGARFQTLRKEAGAAYKIAVAECKQGERATRAACLRQARAVYEQEMAEARRETRMPPR